MNFNPQSQTPNTTYNLHATSLLRSACSHAVPTSHVMSYNNCMHTQSGSYEVPILSYSYTLQFLQSGFFLDIFLSSSLAIQGHQYSGPRRVLPSFTYVGHTCMSFNPKSHTSNPTTQLSSRYILTHSHAVSELLCSQYAIRQFPTSHALMHNQAVSNLIYSQYTIRQFSTSHALNVQTGSSRPPMFSM